MPIEYGATDRQPISSTLEKRTLTIAEVAALTGFSVPTVIRRFEREPGVIVLARPETMHKRKYRSFRIPRHVYERVVRSMSV